MYNGTNAVELTLLNQPFLYLGKTTSKVAKEYPDIFLKLGIQHLTNVLYNCYSKTSLIDAKPSLNRELTEWLKRRYKQYKWGLILLKNLHEEYSYRFDGKKHISYRYLDRITKDFDEPEKAFEDISHFNPPKIPKGIPLKYFRSHNNKPLINTINTYLEPDIPIQSLTSVTNTYRFLLSNIDSLYLVYTKTVQPSWIEEYQILEI